MRALKWVAVVLVAALLVGAITQVARYFGAKQDAADRQDALQPFYTPPDPLPSTKPGTLIRYEPLGETVAGATSYRILYVTQAADGTPTVSGGIILIPQKPAPADGRPVVAWAHGTSGLGDACAPSRKASPIVGQLTGPWMQQMIDFGWIVVATDYAGLGTPGVSQYLIGQSEARDVVNSVRAAHNFPDAKASDDWMVYGHSQGGHASLWTGDLAPTLAPEYSLKAVVAAAPAAELVPLVNEQWNQVAAWVIGPEVAYAWPSVYPNLPIQGVVDPGEIDPTPGLAQECLQGAAIGGLTRQQLGRSYFITNPNDNAEWKKALTEQTPRPIRSLPVLVVQGTGDQVVIPNTTALLSEAWCAAGSRLTTLWLGGQSHNTLGQRAGTLAGNFFFQVLAGRDPGSNCDEPPALPPYPTPVSSIYAGSDLP